MANCHIGVVINDFFGIVYSVVFIITEPANLS